MLGILGEHSFCKTCYTKALGNDENLERNVNLERTISRLRLRKCPNWAPPAEEENGSGPPAAKKAKVEPASSMTEEALKTELRERRLDPKGDLAELVSRLERDRKKDGGCRWKGSVGALPEHMGECGLAMVKCPNESCGESRLRKDLREHTASCEHRTHQCKHCSKKLSSRMLEEHEARCPSAQIQCPNKGCNEKQQRRWINLHRAKCPHEEVPQPSTLYIQPSTLHPTIYPPHNLHPTHLGVVLRADLKSISHSCHVFEVAFA